MKGHWNVLLIVMDLFARQCSFVLFSRSGIVQPQRIGLIAFLFVQMERDGSNA